MRIVYCLVKDNSKIFPTILRVSMRTPALFTCNGLKRFRWYHNTLQKEPMSYYKRLHFNESFPDNAGTYYCVSHNNDGKLFIAETRLEITGIC